MAQNHRDLFERLDRLSVAKVPADEPGQIAWHCIVVLDTQQVFEAEARTPDAAIALAMAQVHESDDSGHFH